MMHLRDVMVVAIGLDETSPYPEWDQNHLEYLASAIFKSLRDGDEYLI